MRRSPLTGPRSVRRRHRLVAVAAVGVLCTLTACTDDPTPAPATTSAAPSMSSPASPSADPSPSQSPSATATSSASASPTASSSPAGFSLEEQRTPSWPELGSDLGIGVEVRVGRHSGYDRVVYEFDGTGRPSYRVRYVDEPKDGVSGDPVDVPGDAVLQVDVSSVATPAEDDPIPTDPSDAMLSGTVVTYAPAIWGGFEGVGEQFIGIRGEGRPFRVTVLQEPTRLVVDIAK